LAAGAPNSRPVPEPGIRTRQQWENIIGLTTTDADDGVPVSGIIVRPRVVRPDDRRY
jgi:hypothetical protein